MWTGLVHPGQQHGHGRGLGKRALRRGRDGEQRDAVAAGIVDDVAQFDGLARPRQRQHDVVAGHHAKVAVAGLGRVDEE